MNFLGIVAWIVLISELPQTNMQHLTSSNHETKDALPDVYMDTSELISYYGYPVEEHKVKTEDGYLLTMHRIPHGKGEEPRIVRPIVFLQHGLITSSSDWVLMGPEKGLAYLLADAGYDVWMGNARGNQYSRAHVTLSSDDSEFWQFTWNEMGKYDLPAEIDYMLLQTGEQHILYVGHSMGSTIFYVMASLKPEYNAKIRAQFSLAPIAYMTHLRSPLRVFAPFVHQIQWISDLFGIDEFLPNIDSLNILGPKLCDNAALTQNVCSNVLFLLLGHDSKQLNETMIPVIIGHVPSGTSSKTVIHYIQGVKSGKFRQYDYGKYENLNFYGQEIPPDYNLSLVTTPVHLYYAENDLFADKKDVFKLASKLPNLQDKFNVPDREFTHLDFLWAIDVKTLVYDKLMATMESYLR